MAHTCKFMWEWIYAKQIAPRDTRGALGGGSLGGQPFKSIEKLSDWHQLWFTSADSSGNGNTLNTSRPSIPQGAFGGGLGCHKFKSSGKLSNGWTDWHKIWQTYADPSENGCTPSKLPLETQGGHLGGFRGQTFKSLGKLSNGWTDWHQLWFTSADSSGNGQRLNTNRL